MNNAGIALLKEFESFVGHAYPDPYSPLGKELRRRKLWSKVLKSPTAIPNELKDTLSGAPWIIGYGFTSLDGMPVEPGDFMDLQEAEIMLREELEEYEAAVRSACKVEPNDNQFAAMVCLAWNIGIGAFKKSTVLKAHNRGDFDSAARAFALWNKAGGETSDGLTRRRLAESVLYLKPTNLKESNAAKLVPKPEPEPMPQRVDPEGTLLKSPIMLTSGGGAVAAGTTAVTLVAETTREVGSIRENLGDWLWPAVAILALAACGFLMYQRLKQRRKGRA